MANTEQESIEQASNTFTRLYDYNKLITPTGILTMEAVSDGFIAGAKWQQEQDTQEDTQFNVSILNVLQVIPNELVGIAGKAAIINWYNSL